MCITATIAYSKLTKQTGLIAHFHSKLDKWFSAWGLSIEQQRVLLHAMAEVLEAEKQTSDALALLIRFFKTFNRTDGAAQYPAEVQQLISGAVLSAIKSPLNAFADRVALLEVRQSLHPLPFRYCSSSCSSSRSSCSTCAIDTVAMYFIALLLVFVYSLITDAF